jgi:hypothetical protein
VTSDSLGRLRERECALSEDATALIIAELVCAISLSTSYIDREPKQHP